MSDESASPATKVAELLKGERFGILTTIDLDGTLISRPMTMQEVEFDGDLWFFAGRDSRKIQHSARPEVNVGAGSGGSWISLTGDRRDRRRRGQEARAVEQRGRGVVPRGPGRRRRRPDQGEADSAEYWDSPGGRRGDGVSASRRRS